MSDEIPDRIESIAEQAERHDKSADHQENTNTDLAQAYRPAEKLNDGPLDGIDVHCRIQKYFRRVQIHHHQRRQAAQNVDIDVTLCKLFRLSCHSVDTAEQGGRTNLVGWAECNEAQQSTLALQYRIVLFTTNVGLIVPAQPTGSHETIIIQGWAVSAPYLNHSFCVLCSPEIGTLRLEDFYSAKTSCKV